MRREDIEVLVADEILPAAQREGGDEGRSAAADELRRRWQIVRVGLLIDLLDLLLPGAIGIRLGVPVGLIVGMLLGRWSGWTGAQSLRMGALIGVYLAFPLTHFLPLGMLVALVAPLPSPGHGRGRRSGR